MKLHIAKALRLAGLFLFMSALVLFVFNYRAQSLSYAVFGILAAIFGIAFTAIGSLLRITGK